jgi:hypothetical protein
VVAPSDRSVILCGQQENLLVQEVVPCHSSEASPGPLVAPCGPFELRYLDSLLVARGHHIDVGSVDHCYDLLKNCLPSCLGDPVAIGHRVAPVGDSQREVLHDLVEG